MQCIKEEEESEVLSLFHSVVKVGRKENST